jgi:transposase
MIRRDLEAENQALKEQNILLQAQVAELRKLIFGARRERFVPNQNPAQASLFAPSEVLVPEAQDAVTKSIKPVKKTKRKPATRNTFPASLAREEQHLLPQDLDPNQETVQIGEDVTELLAYQPSSLFVKRIVRPRLVVKDQEDQGVLQAPIPARLIPKGMVDESLIAQLIVEKIQFHTPLFRFNKKLQQAGVSFISQDNLQNWFHTAAQALLPLYHLLQKDLLAQPYNQADESPVPVLSKDKPGATHRGYMWVLHHPKSKAVYFHYDASRSSRAAHELLGDYQGIVQTDGYEAYQTLQKSKGFTLIHCMAHARRKFVEAKESSPEIAQFYLAHMQQLYHLERQARHQQLDDQKRLELRQQQAVPILNVLEKQMSQDLQRVLPKGPIGKALAYSIKRWKGLSAYALDGQLEIDNNLIENSIRPLALGRKNYLFAGSHEGARSLACLYSIIGTAIQHGLNTQAYLTWLLQKIATHKVTPDAIQWLPHRMPKAKLLKFLVTQDGD